MVDKEKTVVAAMSGGVDSSVAAALLVKQGYKVIGMMLRLWSEPGQERENRCCTPDDMAMARRIAAQVGIPFYAVDVRDQFRQAVVQSFIDGYRAGITPNPCLSCNRKIRWGFLLDQARLVGADYLATGHYARVIQSGDARSRLFKGIDPSKDQSYILSGLNQDQLAHTLLPLGGLTKTEVRKIADEFGLPVAAKSDSQDLCFLGGHDYRTFLSRYAPDTVNPGKILDLDGNIIGEHSGLAFYTIGQRKGLNISSNQPVYVMEKNTAENTLTVGAVEDLAQSELLTGEFNWISGVIPEEPFDAEIKIRYKAKIAPARITPCAGGRVHMRFSQPLRDITPGQLAVAYQGDEVIGSGVIE